MLASRMLALRHQERRSIVSLGLPGPLVGQSGWKLTFADEFATFSENTNYSRRDVGFRTPNGRWSPFLPYDSTQWLPGNDEKQCYLNGASAQSPFSVTNNGLRITAKLSNNLTETQNQQYVSGIINCDGYFNQQYGFWETRMRCPEGQGYWPAIWLLTRNDMGDGMTYDWPPEIDIMEGHGHYLNHTHWAVHSRNNAENAGAWVTVPTDVTKGFHTYACQWDASNITWYFDDVQIAQIPTPASCKVPMFLMVQLAIGGSWPGYVDDTTPMPAYLDIDYVRVYSNDVGAVAISPPSRSVPVMPATPVAATATTTAAATGTATNTFANNVLTNGTSANDAWYTDNGARASIQGGGGDDTLTNISSNYVYLREPAASGNAQVRAWVDVMLKPNVANLTNIASYGLNLYGNARGNRITGGSGTDDLINGRGGNDLITLNGGSNIIVVCAGESANVTITDFKPGRSAPRDRLLLSGYGYANITALMTHLAQSGSNVILTMDNGETVTFNNTTVAVFNAGNFRLTNISSTGGQVADNGWVDDNTQTATASLYTTEVGTVYSDGTTYNNGTRFKVTLAGQVTKLKVYKSSASQTFASVKLWNFSTGSLLATAPATTGSEPVGWITLTLTTPVTLTTNTVDYMVSYRSNVISYIQSGFVGGRIVGPISAYAHPNNGYTISGVDAMPNVGNNGNSLTADIVFVY
jgi:beta-glucanase (GH16 family)